VSSREEGGGTSGASTPTKQRTKMKTTTIISNNGAMVVNAPPELPFLSARGSEAVDVTRAKLTRQLAERTNLKMQVDDVEDLANIDLISSDPSHVMSSIRPIHNGTLYISSNPPFEEYSIPIYIGIL